MLLEGKRENISLSGGKLRIESIGDFAKTTRFLTRMKRGEYLAHIEECCEKGVVALSRATPVDSGKTSESWSYSIKSSADGTVVYWTNSNIVNGFNVAIGLQYGHGTGWGGYVQGLDYINPAIRPIFEEIATDIWQEVVRA